jgi:hypothetical protein
MTDNPPREFRHWIGGRDAGVLEVSFSEAQVSTSNKLKMQRRGSSITQSLQQDYSRNQRGEISVTWALGLASEIQRGRAFWSPTKPNSLRITSKGKVDSVISINPNVLLWPPDIDEKMRLAAQSEAPLQLSSFSFPSSSVSYLELLPEHPAPVGIFKDAILYRGTLKEGASISQITSWISPTAGQVSQISSNAGLIIITQRSELPPPGESSGQGLFEWMLRKLPSIPFLAWRDEIRITGLPEIAETPQQKKIGLGQYLMSRAAPPNDKEARQLPSRKQAGADTEDAPYLADSPLLGLNDAAIKGLIARLKVEADATRWALACRVNRFVFELIHDKGLDVGFATAPEVAGNPKGDCTEHTVLMIALLRCLGVPARAVFGWAGVDMGDQASLGLHAWVEVKIGKRWIPMDPTFDQSPAGAFRVTTGTSSLNSLAELGWDIGLPLEAGITVSAAQFEISGNQIVIDDVNLSVSKGEWLLSEGKVWLLHPALGAISVRGGMRSLPVLDTKHIHVPNRASARYTKSQGQLAVDCGKGRWLYFEGLSEGDALMVLGELE